MKIVFKIQDKGFLNEFRVMNKNVRIVSSDYRDVIYFISGVRYVFPGRDGYRIKRRMGKYENCF